MAKKPTYKIDKHGKEAKVGDKVLWHDRICQILDWDKVLEHIVKIDDPDTQQKYAGSVKFERYIHLSELEIATEEQIQNYEKSKNKRKSKKK